MKNNKFVQQGKLTKSGWLSIVAFLLVAVLALSVALGLVVKSGKEKKGTEEAYVGGMIVPNAHEGNGISLVSIQIPKEQFEDYGIMPIAESAFTVTATAKDKTNQSALPETQQKFVWSMAWSSSFSAEVTDYVTMNDNGKTATFSCLKAFSTKITVTCAWQYDETQKATLPIDYAKRLSGLEVSYASKLATSSNTSYLAKTTITPRDVSDGGVSQVTIHFANSLTLGEEEGDGNWNSTILSFGKSSAKFDAVGTVENTIESIEVKSFLSSSLEGAFRNAPSSAGLSEFVGKFHLESSPLTHSASDTYAFGQWTLLKNLFTSEGWSAVGIKCFGSSVGDSSDSELTYTNKFLGRCSSSMPCFVFDITVKPKYGDPVPFRMQIYPEHEPAQASIEFNQNSIVF